MRTASLLQPSAASVASASSLQDVNAQTYPYDLVQSLLDQTANFSMFTVPDSCHADRATLTPGDPNDWYGLNGGYGLDLLSTLHRFESTVQVTAQKGLCVTQAV